MIKVKHAILAMAWLGPSRLVDAIAAFLGGDGH